MAYHALVGVKLNWNKYSNNFYFLQNIFYIIWNLAGTPGYRNGTESFFGLKGRPSVVRDV